MQLKNQNKARCVPENLKRTGFSKQLSRRPGKSLRISQQHAICREEGIRTLDPLSRKHTFQACALNHSATSLFHPQTRGAQETKKMGLYKI